jgi:hypothetical protein
VSIEVLDTYEALDTWLARALWEFHRQELPGKGHGMEPPWPDRYSGQCARYYAQAARILARLGPPEADLLTPEERAALVVRIDGSQTFERLPNYKALLASARAKLVPDAD